MALTLNHLIGEITNIYSHRSLIGRMVVEDYRKGQVRYVQFKFTTVDKNGVATDEKRYILSNKERAKPFSDLTGYQGYRNDLKISIGQRQVNWAGIRIAYEMSDFIDVIRQRAKKKEHREMPIRGSE